MLDTIQKIVHFQESHVFPFFFEEEEEEKEEERK